MVELAHTTYIPIVIGIIQVIKKVFPKASKFAPLIALILGIALMLISGLTFNNVITGLIVGLSANGLYGGTKYMLK